jgi:hypothetical protein
VDTIVPLDVENAMAVPAGMTLSLKSLTVNVTDCAEGMYGVPLTHGGKVIEPVLTRNFASDPEKMIGRF